MNPRETWVWSGMGCGDASETSASAAPHCNASRHILHATTCELRIIRGSASALNQNTKNKSGCQVGRTPSACRRKFPGSTPVVCGPPAKRRPGVDFPVESANRTSERTRLGDLQAIAIIVCLQQFPCFVCAQTYFGRTPLRVKAAQITVKQHN